MELLAGVSLGTSPPSMRIGYFLIKFYSGQRGMPSKARREVYPQVNPRILCIILSHRRANQLAG
jgi:hypothetical protein